jgi:hypothetical protein
LINSITYQENLLFVGDITWKWKKVKRLSGVGLISSNKRKESEIQRQSRRGDDNK